MGEQYIAMRIGKHYLAVQTCDTGYDYTIYDSAYRLLDGGQIDAPYIILIDKICSEIIAAHTLADTIPEIVDYEELMDRVRRAEYGN